MAAQQRPYGGQQRQGGYQQRDDGPRIDINSFQSKIQNWITNQIDENTIVFADGFGRQIADGGLTTSQIRIVFGEMRRIQMNGYKNQKTDFLLLKAKLAYAVKRHNKPGLTDFFKLFEKAYDAVNKNNDDIGEKNFKNMMDLTEAILAYHKYHGGKE
jgi:CRISPR-associated protein Csm2